MGSMIPIRARRCMLSMVEHPPLSTLMRTRTPASFSLVFDIPALDLVLAI